MSDPKRHHIIPRFYLEQWKDFTNNQRSVIWLLDKETLKPFKGVAHQPHNILVKKHYFTEHEIDGTSHAPVEKDLSFNESTIARLLPLLETGQSLTEDNRNELWSFVLAMFARAALWHESLQDLIKQAPSHQKTKNLTSQKVKARLVKEGYNRADRRKKFKEIDPLIKTELSSLSVDPRVHSLKTKLHPAMVKTALDFEEARTYPFTLIKVEELPLLTSDTPCFFEQDPSIFQLNRENLQGGAFVCPLTPRLAFIGCLGLRDEYATFSSDQYRLLNVRIRANAETKLVANTDAVNETWFLNDQDLPPTMQEIIQPVLESYRRKSSSVGKPQVRGFG